jgi:hypothetical protein
MPAELFEVPQDGSFTVVFPSEANRHADFHIYVSHTDPALLKLYVEECFQEFWGSPI